MLTKFAIGLVIALLLGAARMGTPLPEFDLHLLSAVYRTYPDSIPGIALLILRVGTGVLFILHGWPKITHLHQWADSLHMPRWLCFLSALSMLGGGIALIFGFLTLVASAAIFVSMAFALFLEVKQGLPFVAQDPYLISQGQYEGPKGKGEPPSWEKAFMYCLILAAIAVLGPGAYAVDALIF